MSAEQYAARIRSAVTAHEMHGIAEACARDLGLATSDRARLQTLYTERSRQMFPAAFRRRSR